MEICWIYDSPIIYHVFLPLLNHRQSMSRYSLTILHNLCRYNSLIYHRVRHIYPTLGRRGFSAMSKIETLTESWIPLSNIKNLQDHSRWTLNLRSNEGRYHGIILFRLSVDQNVTGDVENDLQLYAMESNCPHLGADMSHAEIEEADDGIVAVCPWHRYDFDLRTGVSSASSLKACTYPVVVKDGQIYMQPPDNGSKWRLVDMRVVSEEFADMGVTPSSSEVDPLVPETNPPQTLIQWAVLILNTPNPTLKVERTRHAVHLFRTGQLKSIGNKVGSPAPPEIPPRESSMKFVQPGKALGNRKKNRAVMLHALACIEQWAIDLSWDIIARYGPQHPELPHAFFSDFTKMALDEAKHFTLLTSRLVATSPDTPYGTFPVHATLWDSARSTFPSLRARLAIIHLVHEARGLDVNPGTIERFRRAGDTDSVSAMEIIHADEVTHVTSGHRWFVWLCQQEEARTGVPIDVIKTFRKEVKSGWRGEVRGPFNAKDREKAGMSKGWYEKLAGDMT